MVIKHLYPKAVLGADVVANGPSVESAIYHCTKLLQVASHPVVLSELVKSVGVSNETVYKITRQDSIKMGIFTYVDRKTKRAMGRSRTRLNAYDMASLVGAIKTNGVLGTPLVEVYAEYADAYIDVHRSDSLFVGASHVWHVSVAQPQDRSLVVDAHALVEN